MSTVTLSESTYRLLKRRAQDRARTPDQEADDLLQQQLAPQHAYIEVIDRPGGPSAVITGTQVGVRDVVGYLRIGEMPESLVEHILPHGSTAPHVSYLAQVYDALSYYNDHRVDIDRELSLNTEEHARQVLRDSLGEEGYRRVIGQLA
jgi:uncharacterized protein (DUF433 family)